MSSHASRGISSRSAIAIAVSSVRVVRMRCVVALGAGALLIAATPASSRRAVACAETNSRTMVQNAQARVYERTFAPHKHSMFACDRRSGIRTQLARVDRHGDEPLLTGALALRGRLVSYAVRLCSGCSGGPPPPAVIITVKLPHRGAVNASTRSPGVRAGYADGPEFPPLPAHGLSVRRLLIAANTHHTRVWSTCAAPISITASNACERPLQAVRIIASSADPRGTLDEQPGIDPDSLRLSRDRKSAVWTVNGQTKSTLLGDQLRRGNTKSP